MSELKVNTITDASGGNTASFNGATATTDNTMGRNRIINGDMRIDQRNAGAAVTDAIAFPVDRMRVTHTTDGAYSAQQDSSAPDGFVNSLKFTTTTADASLTTTQNLSFLQRIEGYNFADLNWGTANAKTVTLSFWVRSSLTGTFGGSLRNSAGDRSYPFTYTISSADTWEQKSVTIAGDTSGTWLTTNGIGIQVTFGLGSGPDRTGTAGSWASSNYVSATGAVSVIGTLNATWYITGVQLEAGSVATSFERRSYGQELALCQRYYYKNFPALSNACIGWGFNGSTTLAVVNGSFPVQMRVRPTALEQSGTASDYSVAHGATSTTCSSVPVFDAPTTQNIYAVIFTVASGLTVGQGSQGRVGAAGFLAWSAEL